MSMFGTLTDRFNDALGKLSGKREISETNVREAMADVRRALLEADVHLDVVKTFMDSVMDKALGTEVLQSVQPGQQMIKIVYDELVRLMGDETDLEAAYHPDTSAPRPEAIMEIEPGPTVVMMSGLQGSGKTTTCGKLAAHLKKQGKRVMLAAADLQRPAAVQQLGTLVEQVNEQVTQGPDTLFYAEMDKVAEYGKAVGAAVEVSRHAVNAARQAKADVLILDTAGRLHINDALMDELKKVQAAVTPHHIFLVVDAMTGQDAVNSAKAFNDSLEIDGVILTKFDSDTRGGAALSVKHVTGKPIKFIGVGEKLENLERFHPERIAQRILGMGDIVSLVEKAQEQVSEEEAMALQDKLAKGKLTMDDFLKQLKMIRRMGSFKSLLGLLPGIGSQLKNLDIDERQIDRTEAIIQSMTPDERRHAEKIEASRRRRIARGSGSETSDVGQLIKSFDMMSKIGQQMGDMSALGRYQTMASMGPEHLAALSGGGKGGKPAGGQRKSAKPKLRRPKRRSR